MDFSQSWSKCCKPRKNEDRFMLVKGGQTVNCTFGQLPDANYVWTSLFTELPIASYIKEARGTTGTPNIPGPGPCVSTSRASVSSQQSVQSRQPPRVTNPAPKKVQKEFVEKSSKKSSVLIPFSSGTDSKLDVLFGAEVQKLSAIGSSFTENGITIKSSKNGDPVLSLDDSNIPAYSIPTGGEVKDLSISVKSTEKFDVNSVLEEIKNHDNFKILVQEINANSDREVSEKEIFDSLKENISVDVYFQLYRTNANSSEFEPTNVSISIPLNTKGNEVLQSGKSFSANTGNFGVKINAGDLVALATTLVISCDITQDDFVSLNINGLQNPFAISPEYFNKNIFPDLKNDHKIGLFVTAGMTIEA